jgi:purine nucleosidase
LPIPLIMDVDTGVDDAMALALATRLDTHDLLAVTTVAGNVNVESATRNTLRVLDWMGSDVPVYRGMSQPLVRPLHTATSVHGNDGLGSWDVVDAGRPTEALSGPEAILHYARAHRGEIDGVFVGPLTNLAVALILEPELAGWFRQITIMGGAFFRPGNVTPAAEFNIFVDPEAASIVARLGMRTRWIGLDVTHRTSLTLDEWRSLDVASDPAAVLVREVSRQSFDVRDRDEVFLHDPLAVAVAAYPDLVDESFGQVLVDTGHLARGETRLSETDSPSSVAREVDTQQFHHALNSLLKLVR